MKSARNADDSSEELLANLESMLLGNSQGPARPLESGQPNGQTNGRITEEMNRTYMNEILAAGVPDWSFWQAGMEQPPDTSGPNVPPAGTAATHVAPDWQDWQAGLDAPHVMSEAHGSSLAADNAADVAADWSLWETYIEGPQGTTQLNGTPFREGAGASGRFGVDESILRSNGWLAGSHGSEPSMAEGSNRSPAKAFSDEEVLSSLLDAFPDVDLEDMAMAYVQANKEPNLTVELLMLKLSAKKQGPSDPGATNVRQASASEDQGTEWESWPPETSVVGEAAPHSDAHHQDRDMRAPHPDRHVAGVHRGVSVHRAEGSSPGQPDRTLRESDSNNPWQRTPSATSAKAVLQIAAIFGEELKFGTDIIRDVLDVCGGEVDKAVEELLKLVCSEEMPGEQPMGTSADVAADPHSNFFATLSDMEVEEGGTTNWGEDWPNRAAGGLAAPTPSSTLTAGTAAGRKDPIWKANEKKLRDAFPSANPEVLQNVLEATNNSFSDAFKMLTESGLQPVNLHPSSWVVPPPAWGHLSSPGPSSRQARVSPPRRPSPPRSGRSWQASKDHYGGQAVYSHERKEAQNYANARNRYYHQATMEYKRGNKAYAASLAAKGREYNEMYRKENLEAAARIAKKINEKHQIDLPVDLHQLHVGEALTMLRTHLEFLKLPTIRALKVITGRGHHSADGKAKVKPAVINYLNQEGYPWSTDPSNSGVLYVFGEDASARRTAPPRPTLATYFS